MTTFRVKKDANYSVISNGVINDTRLSWGARGLLVYLLSKPDNWIVTTAHLEKQSDAGRHATNSLIKELKDAGYMERTRRQNKDGVIVWETNVYEMSTMSGFSADGSPVDGKPVHIVSTEEVSTKTPAEKKPQGADDKTGKKKTDFAQRMEYLESEFAKYRQCPPPDWENGSPAALNKRWRTPLKRMLKSADDDLELTARGVREVTRELRQKGLTFSAPDGIEKTFASWIIDNGKNSAPVKSGASGGVQL